jgi:hypothetical protein
MSSALFCFLLKLGTDLAKHGFALVRDNFSKDHWCLVPEGTMAAEETWILWSGLYLPLAYLQQFLGLGARVERDQLLVETLRLMDDKPVAFDASIDGVDYTVFPKLAAEFQYFMWPRKPRQILCPHLGLRKTTILNHHVFSMRPGLFFMGITMIWTFKRLSRLLKLCNSKAQAFLVLLEMFSFAECRRP